MRTKKELSFLLNNDILNVYTGEIENWQWIFSKHYASIYSQYELTFWFLLNILLEYGGYRLSINVGQPICSVA